MAKTRYNKKTRKSRNRHLRIRGGAASNNASDNNTLENQGNNRIINFIDLAVMIYCKHNKITSEGINKNTKGVTQLADALSQRSQEDLDIIRDNIWDQLNDQTQPEAYRIFKTLYKLL
jgi:hypothetical protein